MTHLPKTFSRNFDPHRDNILVALSGGADSVALLCMLHALGADIQALHCNFQLRGKESVRDEQFVTLLCQRLDVKLHVKHFDTQFYARQQGISLEMAARDLRYQWFEQMHQQLGADLIAVAHHREDQVETVLLNLIRGTGLRGLAGMRERNGNIIRPLLYCTKAEILEYLHDIRQDYVTDSTNLERDAWRNRLRLDVIPLLTDINPKASEHIAQTARHVAEALPYYLHGVALSADESADATLLTPTLLHELLQGKGFTVSQESEMLRSQRSGAVFESPTHRATFRSRKLVVEEKQEPSPLPKLIQEIVLPDGQNHLTATNDVAYIDAALVRQGLTLRHPRQGDRFRPLGMRQGSRLVSDFLTGQHLSVFEKERQWLVCDGDEIVWVVGQRIDDRYRITDRTRQMLRLSLSEPPSCPL